MFKDYDKSLENDDLPINSPEYLKRFQRSFNPMYIPKDAPVILGSMPKTAKGVTILSSAFSSGSFLSSLYLSSRKLGSGSGFGSGSAMFSGLGYGIELI